VGAVVLGGVFYWVARFVQNRGWIDVACGCGVFAIVAVALTFVLRRRLLLDSRGIERRRFFRSDSWTWTEIASGRIRKSYAYTLLDPNRPWWRRKLSLDYYYDDIPEIWAAVNAHYQLPPPPTLGESLTVKYGFRRSVTLDRSGIQLFVRGAPHMYLWREVRLAHFTRMDPLRRDFKSLELTLPDQTIQWKLSSTQYGTYPTWRGATSEEISEFLLHHLAPDQIDTSIAGEPPKKREYIEKKLRAAKNQKRQFVIILAILLPLLIGTLIWMAIGESVVKAVFMAAFSAILFGPVLVFLYRSNSKQIADLESRLDSLVDDG